MANPITQRTDTLEVWRSNLNSIGNNVGDPSSIYVVDGTDIFIPPTSNILVAAINDLNSRKVKRSGDTIASLAVTNGLTVGGTTALSVATATTPAVDTTDTHLATCAFVIGQAATNIPAMNGGSGAVGTAIRWARGDHSHPSDPSLATNANPVFSGTVSLNTGLGAPISDIQVMSLTTTSTSPNQVVGSFPIATYRSGEFIIQAVDSTGLKYHSATVKVVHDGTNVSAVEYAAATTANGVCGTFSADINTGNLRLLVQPASVNSTVFKVLAIMSKV